MKRTVNLLSLFFFMLTTGCVDLHQEYFINSDGSGKVVCKFKVGTAESVFSSAENYGISPSKLMAGKIQDQLQNYQGIEKWRDISYKLSNDKKTFHYNATGYFRNLSDCTFYVPQLDIRPHYILNYQPDGKITIALKTATEPAAQLTGKNLSAQQRAEAIIEARIIHAKKRLTNKIPFSSLKVYQVFHLPSQIIEYSNFTKAGPYKAELAVNGNEILASMNSLMGNNNWLSDKVTYTLEPFTLGWGQQMHQKLFGRNAPVEFLLYPSSRMLFDYDLEIATKDLFAEPNRQSSITSAAPGENEEYYVIPQGLANDKTALNEQLREGIKLEQDGQFDSAIQIYANIIANQNAEDKHLARANYQIGMCLYNNGFEAQAIEQLEYVIENFPFETTPAMKAGRQLHLIRSGRAVPKYIKDTLEKAVNPSVIATTPANFAEGVPADTNYITLTFDMPMQSQSWLYSSFPGCELPQPKSLLPAFDDSSLTWKLPVSLQPGRVYAITVNHPDAINVDLSKTIIGFKNAESVPAKPFVLVFTTLHEKTGSPIFMEEDLRQKCREFNLENSQLKELKKILK